MAPTAGLVPQDVSATGSAALTDFTVSMRLLSPLHASHKLSGAIPPDAEVAELADAPA